MLHELGIVFQPLVVLLCGNIIATILNFFLVLFFLIPDVFYVEGEFWNAFNTEAFPEFDRENKRQGKM